MNPFSRGLRVLFGVSALLPLAGFGALSWDARKIELTAKPADQEAIAVFRFVNAGTTTITITAVTPSCGCTTTELARRTYAPGAP